MLANIALAVLKQLLLLLMLLVLVTKLLLMVLLLLLQVELVLVVDQVQVVRVEGLDGRRLHSDEGAGRRGGGGDEASNAQVVVDLHRSLGQGDRQRILHVAHMSFISSALIKIPMAFQNEIHKMAKSLGSEARQI